MGDSSGVDGPDQRHSGWDEVIEQEQNDPPAQEPVGRAALGTVEGPMRGDPTDSWSTLHGKSGRRAEQQHVAIPGLNDLFGPPSNMYQESEHSTQWDWAAREIMLALRKINPTLLQASLRHWVMATIDQVPHTAATRISTKRLGHIIYGMRGLKIKEFVELMQATDFAEAIYMLTSIRVGYKHLGSMSAGSGDGDKRAHIGKLHPLRGEAQMNGPPVHQETVSHRTPKDLPSKILGHMQFDASGKSTPSGSVTSENRGRSRTPAGQSAAGDTLRTICRGHNYLPPPIALPQSLIPKGQSAPEPVKWQPPH